MWSANSPAFDSTKIGVLFESVLLLERCCVAKLWRVRLWLKIFWANMVGGLLVSSLPDVFEAKSDHA